MTLGGMFAVNPVRNWRFFTWAATCGFPLTINCMCSQNMPIEEPGAHGAHVLSSRLMEWNRNFWACGRRVRQVEQNAQRRSKSGVCCIPISSIMVKSMSRETSTDLQGLIVAFSDPVNDSSSKIVVPDQGIFRQRRSIVKLTKVWCFQSQLLSSIVQCKHGVMQLKRAAFQVCAADLYTSTVRIRQ